MSDLSKLSDDELRALYSAPQNALASMSDDELRAAYGAPEMGGAFSDIPKEIAGAFNENLDAIKGMFGGTAEKGVLQQTLDVGKGLAAIPGLIASPITGTARSLIGHPLASAIQSAGSVVDSFMGSDIASTEDPREVYEAAKGGVDTAMMAAAPRAASPLGMRTLPQKAPLRDDIAAAADAGFDAARNSGVQVPAKDVQAVAQQIQQDLYKAGFRGNLGKETRGLVDELAAPPAGAVADVADLHSMRQAFGKAAGSIDAQERLAAKIAQDRFDKYLETVSPDLKEAIRNYATVKASDTVTGRLDRAVDNAASANSGMNVENAIRQQMKALKNNRKEFGKLSAEEKKMVNSIVRGTSPSNILRAAGNMLGGGLGMWGAMTGVGGATMLGPLGAAIPLAGWATKQLGNLGMTRKVGKLDEMTRARSPLARSTPPRIAGQPSGLLGLLPASQIQMLPAGLLGNMRVYAEEDQ